ncbi:thiopeptide-type bacteriocin biosynthesis protein [Sciscionella marina]|uniref:thiopeptide-type bacteriocin biosynthesis protein n=1 Tax=Sciscionella marina TaxID=508770 RepID=UPI00037AAE0B|nr:thiopeptide-type bacteriocin biosynthesis protein [Sciscionella marina]
MPADNLNPNHTVCPEALHAAVHHALTGAALPLVAAEHGLNHDELHDAVEVFLRAGASALYEYSSDPDWYSAHLEFSDWDQAERIALLTFEPLLNIWTGSGLLERWWFIRKAPAWRLRLQPGPNAGDILVPTANDLFDKLVTSHTLADWRPVRYEPEAHAFGGPTGIRLAHQLFHADSVHLFAYLAHDQPPIGIRELSILLCTVLFRAADQEGFETGDIWHRVTYLRPSTGHDSSTSTGHHTELTEQLRTLLRYDTHPGGPLFGDDGPLHELQPWAQAFHDCGHALAAVNHTNQLHRGLRNVLAHHVIFHWNRCGFDQPTQHALAHAAATTAFELRPEPDPPP